MSTVHPTTYDHILQVATEYFSHKGYHGTSIREIAREAGVSISTLYYHVDSKDNLYRLVFQKQFQEENEIISGIIENAPEDVVLFPSRLRTLLCQIMDAIIDRSIENPEVVNLWTRRWLEKPSEPDDIETFFSIPLYQMVADLLSQAKTEGIIKPKTPDLDLFLHSFTWLHYGFFGFGQLSYQARVGNPVDPAQIEAFRAYIRVYVDQMLGFET
jgi:AcrR family transcriptional regulator